MYVLQQEVIVILLIQGKIQIYRVPKPGTTFVLTFDVNRDSNRFA
jgi:hypothetical protein